MQRKSVFLMAALFAFGALMCAANAHAFGIGPYFESASGSGSFLNTGDSYQPYLYDENGDIDTDVTGVGVVMDSNLSSRRVFNYRLSLGYNTIDYPNEIDGWRVSLDNTFGFGIVRTERFRLWIGPQIHLSYGEMDISPDDIFGDYYDDELKDSVGVLGFGIGLVTGANFNLPQVGSICAELGARYQGNWADTYEYRSSYYNGYSYSSYSYGYDVDYSYEETVIFFKLSFMFGK